MRKIILLGLAFGLLQGSNPANSDAGSAARVESAAAAESSLASISIENPSLFEREDQPVYLTLNALGVKTGALEDGARTILVQDKQGVVPSQLIDSDGDGINDQLLISVDLKAAQTRKLTLTLVPAADSAVAFEKRTQAELSIKQGGEWQGKTYVGGDFVNVQSLTPPPQYTDHSYYIRYEGPGIESDRIAYRFYLDWRNGFDIFAKVRRGLALQNIGQDGYESYHHLSDWGMDVLKVGQSLGMGGYGYWDGKAALRVSDVDRRTARIINNGAIFSSLTIDYDGWNIADQKVDLQAHFSMTAGSPLVHTRLHLSKTLPNLVVGLVKHDNTEVIRGDLDITGQAWSYIATFGQQSLNNDDLGMFLLFKKEDLQQATEDDHSQVAVLDLNGGTDIDYYFGALWSAEPEPVTDVAGLRAFLENEVEKLTLAPRISLKTTLSQSQKTAPMTSKQALDWAVRVADSEMQRRGDSLAYGGFDQLRGRVSDWNYTTGLLMHALDDVGQATGKAKYSDYARKTIDSFLTDDGVIRGYDESEYNIDQINSGKMLVRYYQRTGGEKYKAAAAALAHQLENHPRTSEGAFWHKKRYPGQLWMDGVYMGMPFLAGYAVSLGTPEQLKEAVHEFEITRAHLRDPKTGLYFHAWDEKKQQNWADPETGLSHYVWGRGMGWFAMALVDVLDFIPEDQEELRRPLLAMVSELADTLRRYQDESGVWYQIVDMPEKEGNYLEASGSSMFVYFLADALNHGYLPETYRPVALKGFQGLVNEFINVAADQKVSVTNICEVAGLGFGRDGSYRYYMSEPVIDNDPKGLGPFVMAAIKVSQLLQSN